MRGVSLDPDFGKNEMRKILNQYTQYIKPIENMAKKIYKQSRGKKIEYGLEK